MLLFDDLLLTVEIVVVSIFPKVRGESLSRKQRHVTQSCILQQRALAWDFNWIVLVDFEIQKGGALLLV